MLGKKEIDEILGDKDEGWFPPVEKLLPDNAEEFIAMQKARVKEVKGLEKEGIYAVEMGRCRSNCYPTCSICDWDARWGIQTKRVYNCKRFSVDSSGTELADGKPCKVFHACRRHLHKVVKLCKDREEKFGEKI